MITASSFRAAWWLRNPHLQTLYRTLFANNVVRLPLRRERLTTSDGDFIDIDWYGSNSGPLVILLHGLTGSSRSGYIAMMQSLLASQGIRSVALNFRGCSGEPNLLARGYHSGDSADIDFVYRTLRQREPNIPMAVVGYSLGGNVLLKWLGEQGKSLTLRAAVAVSVPLQLNLCATKLDQGLSRIYRHHLLTALKQYIYTKRTFLQHSGNRLEAAKLEQLGDLTRVRSFWEYDDLVVARLHGFSSATSYYQQSSSRQFLGSIAIPTLIIQAKDDPFMTPQVLPAVSELSSAVTLELTQCGGHLGFIAGKRPFAAHFWLEQRIGAFLQYYL